MVDRVRVVARRRWTGADRDRWERPPAEEVDVVDRGGAYEGRDWFKAAYFIGMFLVLVVLGVMVYWRG